ncbi:hypothetical protein D9619_008839 [Psilocybe cf. subviscida]|uniref:Altered inheritance of mitochondria protein 9, mitochondrial n=1 Tax=Psilocybe cf. subviscida TaxID=2480587 RepID=A0A8H5BAC0_9AGAR|nr:hypothetical protein D9619_008839 [Psilocybe cf. subviscida]
MHAIRRIRTLSTMALSSENFFKYTSGRFIHDQEHHEALHYRRFNVDALKEDISRSTGAASVMDMSKLSEGRCNKVFQVQLADSQKVIARIPMPFAGPQHLVTASEVATMTFLRNRLGLTQVPRIISWLSRASETPVGAEYIVMDVADGIELGAVWEILTMHQKIHVVLEWVKFEWKVIHAFSRGGYGSLYFRKDLPTNQSREIFLANSDQPDDEYVLGPAVSGPGYWEENYGTPDDIKLDRGPWPDVSSYLKSLSNCERAWIEKYAKRPTRMYAAPWELPVHLRIPEEHLRLLDMYDKVCQCLISPDEREALMRGTVEISAVIDWQHTVVLPLYLTSFVPRFVDYASALPGQDEAEFAKEQAYLRKTYHTMYADANINTVWAAALAHQGQANMSQLMPEAARICWHGGYTVLKQQMVEAALDWKYIAPRVPCPLAGEHFSEKDLAKAEADVLEWKKVERALDDTKERIGMCGNAVRPDHYNRAVQINKELREEWASTGGRGLMEGANPRDIWPFG